MCEEDVLWPFEASRFISNRAKEVKICNENIKKIADVIINGMNSNEFDLADWKKLDVNPKTADEAAINWIFFVDTLNFSFWTPVDEKFIIKYKNKPYTGYFSLCASVQRALENGIMITNPNTYSKLTMDELKNILRSDNGIEMPLLDERLEILHTCGRTLIEKFGGSFINCLKKANGSAKTLLKLVVENFPSYRDEAIYENQKVAFYKRAQILIADIWACFEGKGDGYFSDIESITMFADYRIPQVLAYFKVLIYSNDLENKLRQEKLMRNKERDEVEIRGCTIWAVELIKEELRKRKDLNCDVPINSITVDFFLWEYRRKHPEIDLNCPYHRVRCIYY